MGICVGRRKCFFKLSGWLAQVDSFGLRWIGGGITSLYTDGRYDLWAVRRTSTFSVHDICPSAYWDSQRRTRETRNGTHHHHHHHLSWPPQAVEQQPNKGPSAPNKQTNKRDHEANILSQQSTSLPPPTTPPSAKAQMPPSKPRS